VPSAFFPEPIRQSLDAESALTECLVCSALSQTSLNSEMNRTSQCDAIALGERSRNHAVCQSVSMLPIRGLSTGHAVSGLFYSRIVSAIGRKGLPLFDFSTEPSPRAWYATYRRLKASRGSLVLGSTTIRRRSERIRSAVLSLSLTNAPVEITQVLQSKRRKLATFPIYGSSQRPTKRPHR
jgi:hypothetical protein